MSTDTRSPEPEQPRSVDYMRGAETHLSVASSNTTWLTENQKDQEVAIAAVYAQLATAAAIQEQQKS